MGAASVLLLSLLLEVLFASAADFDDATYPGVTHTHSSALDSNGTFTVFWTPDLENKEIVFELHVKTHGWIGFGWSPNGGMKGGDFLTAFVDEGRLVLEDRYAPGEFEPPVDEQQDWRPLSGRENETHTIVVASRPFETCDSNDIPVNNETMRLIYAWGDTDELSYHGAHRGTRSAFLLVPFHKRKIDDDAITWAPRFKSVIPAGDDTAYRCEVLKFPVHEPVHYLGFDVAFGRNAKQHVHHILVYECGKPKNRDGYEKLLSKGDFECYTPNMPEETLNCLTMVVLWNFGSEGEMLPENVGYPFGETSPHPETYFMIEVHLNNPEPKGTVLVEWGLNIYYTRNLRPKVAGFLSFGSSLMYSVMVPPERERYMVTGICSPKCFDVLPPEGINVFGTFFHTHLLGREVYLRLFRDGKELPPIDKDENYDFNFQQSRRFQEELKILPGDIITADCIYSSVGKKNVTFVGLSTRDEMCFGHIYYYPKVPLTQCLSSPNQHDYLKEFNLTSFLNEVEYFDYDFNPDLKNGDKYQTYMNKLLWKQLDVQDINKKLFYGNHEILCLNGHIRYNLSQYNVKYPDAVPYVEPKSEICSSASATRSPSNMGLLLMLSFLAYLKHH